MEKMKRNRRIALYYSVSIYIGMASAVLGPSILYLVKQTNATLTDLIFIFPARSGSYVVGSWLAGLLFDRYRGHKILTIGLVIMGITLSAVPFILNASSLVGVILALGIAMGLVDVGCNTLLFQVKSIDIGPAMNGLHFFYGLGSFLAPLILASSLQLQDTIQVGYLSLGVFSLLVLGQIVKLQEPRGGSRSLDHDLGASNNGQGQLALILVIALFFFAFVGVEIGYGDWLSTYSLKSLLTDDQGAILLTSVYWGAFTGGRLISIPLAAQFKARKLLLVDLIGAFLGLGLVLVFPSSLTALWAGTIILGISLASVFPTTLTYAENYLKMTGKITSRFFISGSIGSMFVPWIIGGFVERVGPPLIIQALFLILMLAAIMFILMLSFAKKTPANNSAGA